MRFFLSNFQTAAFLTADWQGELECVSRGIGSDTKLTVFDTQWMPHSIGMFYATFTQLLGYRPDNDEWKVMALSAENVDSLEFEKRIFTTVRLLSDGKFELDQSVYTGALTDQPKLYSEKLLKLLNVCQDEAKMNANKEAKKILIQTIQRSSNKQMIQTNPFL